MNATADNQHPVAAVVLPLRNRAMGRAEAYARDLAKRFLDELEAADWDVNVVAPLPQSLNESRRTYREKVGRHKLFLEITEADTERNRSARSSRDPHYRCYSAERFERFIGKAREQAAIQYDAFMLKLIDKVGEAESASLEGDHVWGHSILTVTKPDGSITRWKTQMILNVSKLGTVFNQWPTRRMR